MRFELLAGGLIDASFAKAEGAPLSTAIPKAGYVFVVLTGQGANASGGAQSYVSGGRMTIGYGIAATANQYDGVGRNTFVLNFTGTIYQKDQGSSGVPPTNYNPDSTWVVAE